MSENLIVTIDREYGSGGHEIGKRLAERLGIKFYDEALISMAAEKTGYHEKYIKANEEKAPEFAVTGIFSGVDMFQASPFTQIQEEEFHLIRELADTESCVIVGRAADYILSDKSHVSIFIFAPIEERIDRKLELIKINGTEPMTRAEMEKKVKHTDKQRRKYYEFYTDNKWGGREVYDLLINASRTGINGAVDIIETYISSSKGKDLFSDM